MTDFLKLENLFKQHCRTSGEAGIALDLGTSGFRAQLVDLSADGRVTATAMTERHPLPGANVMDHLHFALETGPAATRKLMVAAVNRLIAAFGGDPALHIRMALCGNPIQLSLFQGLEIRDLAYAGQRKRKRLGVTPPDRNARRIPAGSIPGLALSQGAEILVPPAVKHEIGADALALILETGLETRSEPCLAIDFGTNAEMALAVDGVIHTGSAAAGPALEGQHITHGMLALPGAISDLNPAPSSTDNRRSLWRTTILDRNMMPQTGETLHIATGKVHRSDAIPGGVTGTGVVALLAEAISAGFIQRPRISTADRTLCLSENIRFTETDLSEAGKACGAIRAGILTLCRAAGIRPAEIETVFMAGAAGTHMDALKARSLGLIPGRADKVFQVGNTSLAAAVRLARRPEELGTMQAAADRLRARHLMFARSEDFKNAYLLELSHWGEGLPRSEYRRFLKRFQLPDWPEPSARPPDVGHPKRKLQDLGDRAPAVVRDIGGRATVAFDGCTGTGRCADQCPGRALVLDRKNGNALSLDLSLCRGASCRMCESACDAGALHWKRFFSESKKEAIQPVRSR